MRYGAVEAGGTKFLCAVGSDPEHLGAITEIPTGHPHDTLDQVVAYFQVNAIDRLGVAAFGPLNLDTASADFGAITNSPKREWQGINLRQYLHHALGKPVVIETDVNAALIAERTLGAARGTSRSVYLTIGTGIGGSFWTDHGVYKGLLHPEMGHMAVPRVAGDTFAGSCPFHADCLEGMASGVALWQRWNQDPQTLASNHRAWTIEADYLASALASIFYILTPERIVMGGGVMHQLQLFPLIRQRVHSLLNGYLQPWSALSALDAAIVPPYFSSTAGLVGALLLAQSAA